MMRWLHVKGTAQTVGYWLAVAFSCVAVYRLHTGAVSASWLLLTFTAYMWCVMTITAGYHRLFAHRSYTCSRLWHYAFGLTGVVFLQGSPISWAAVHHTHHKHADTDKDSHITDWRYWVGRRYGPIAKTKKGLIHLLRDPLHGALHQYGLLFPLAFTLLLLLVSFDVFLFLYALPMAVFFVFSNVHQSFSHFGGRPRNVPWMEFVLPACGEWTHAAHHSDPRAWRFGRVDLGAWFIARIKYA